MTCPGSRSGEVTTRTEHGTPGTNLGQHISCPQSQFRMAFRICDRFPHTRATAQHTHSTETGHGPPPLFRPNRATEGDGKLFPFRLRLCKDSALIFSLFFLLLPTYSLPILPPPFPNPPNASILCVLDLSGGKVGSFSKE